jgi:hypothetical protein
MQQELGNTASGDALRGSSLPGAGAKQEQRLFRDLPELLSTAADGPVIWQGFLCFRRSADCVDNPGGQVGTYRQVKGSRSLLRATAIKLW